MTTQLDYNNYCLEVQKEAESIANKTTSLSERIKSIEIYESFYREKYMHGVNVELGLAKININRKMKGFDKIY